MSELSQGLAVYFSLNRSPSEGDDLVRHSLAFPRRGFAQAGERRRQAFELEFASPPVATRNGLAPPVRIGAPDVVMVFDPKELDWERDVPFAFEEANSPHSDFQRQC